MVLLAEVMYVYMRDAITDAVFVLKDAGEPFAIAVL